MAGHTPTVLEFTASSHPPPILVPRILDLLKRKYFAQLRRDTKRRPDDIASDGGPILLGDQEVFMAIEFLASRDGTTQLSPAIELDSAAYESARDVLRAKSKRQGRRALVDFCATVAEVAAAEAFRLRFHDSPAQPLSMSSLVQDLTLVDRSAGLVVGLALSSPSLPEVRRFWPNWVERNGFAVLDFL